MTNTTDYLASLDPGAFMKLLPNRRKMIDAAPAKALPKTWRVNETAKLLHPEEQYLRVAKIINHGNDAKSFVLQPDKDKGNGKCAYFRAGQYLSVFLDIGEAKLAKPYSIRSGPTEVVESNQYTITVKRAKDGYASDYILDTWKAGTAVRSSGPEGNFYYESLRDGKTVVGLAGGSGITPFYSLACAIADGIEDCDLILLYGSRTSADILLKAEFDYLASTCPRIKVIHILSDENTQGFETGFLTADLIKKYAPAGDYSLFICGPQVMYDFVDQEIEKLGITKKWIRHELFGEYKNPEKKSDYPKTVTGKSFKLTVNIRGRDTIIECAASQTLLAAIESAGIAAPSHCRSGECGWCRSRLISGEVYVPESLDGRRLADYKFGFLHPCVSFPLSDIKIDVPVKG
jgi:ferredoxin-NADP reductase